MLQNILQTIRTRAGFRYSTKLPSLPSYKNRLCLKTTRKSWSISPLKFVQIGFRFNCRFSAQQQCELRVQFGDGRSKGEISCEIIDRMIFDKWCCHLSQMIIIFWVYTLVKRLHHMSVNLQFFLYSIGKYIFIHGPKFQLQKKLALQECLVSPQRFISKPDQWGQSLGKNLPHQFLKGRWCGGKGESPPKNRRWNGDETQNFKAHPNEVEIRICKDPMFSQWSWSIPSSWW